MVVSNKLMPLVWDSDILIVYMVESVLQHTIDVPSPWRHIEQYIARESRHSAGVTGLFRLRLRLLLLIVGTGFGLAAFIHSLDCTILLREFCLESN